MPFLTILLALVAPLAARQTPAPSNACNNLNRNLLVEAGTTQSTVQCGAWSLIVQIAGQSITISAPTECVTSLVVRTGDTFGCQGTANGIHCRTDGDQIHIITRVNATPCPSLPVPPPTTAAEARAATSCAPLGPAITEVNNSASIKNCTTSVPGHLRVDGEVVGTGQDALQVRIGDPSALFTPAVPNALYEPWLALETAELSSLPTVLQQTLVSCPTVFGFRDLLATVEYRFAVPGSSEPVLDRMRIEGVVLADQRFDFTKTLRADGPDGEPTIAAERLVYDGASLFTHVPGNSTGNLWCSSSPRRDTMRATSAHVAALLSDWAYKPFWILRVPGTQYSVESSAGSPVVTVTESYPWATSQGAPVGTTVYFIDVSGAAKPVAILSRDLEGNVLVRRDYSDYRLVDGATWRPFSILESRFHPGGSEPWVVINLSIQEATLVDASAAPSFARPAFADEVWFVRR